MIIFFIVLLLLDIPCSVCRLTDLNAELGKVTSQFQTSLSEAESKIGRQVQEKENLVANCQEQREACESLWNEVSRLSKLVEDGGKTKERLQEELQALQQQLLIVGDDLKRKEDINSALQSDVQVCAVNFN